MPSPIVIYLFFVYLSTLYMYIYIYLSIYPSTYLPTYLLISTCVYLSIYLPTYLSTQVFNALIVVAYPSGEPAHAHFISHERSIHYWARWLARLEEYRTMFAHDLSEVHI